MLDQATFPIVCITESELLQWKARGRIHLLKDRVIFANGIDDFSLFAACPALKLDDAKGRVIATLRHSALDDSRLLKGAKSKAILDLTISDISYVSAILPQHSKRLETLGLPMSSKSYEIEWDFWLLEYGAHERFHAISEIFNKIGFSINANMNVSSVKLAMRPNEPRLPEALIDKKWLNLLKKRDSILQNLRFEGHSGCSSFFSASITHVIDTENLNHQLTDDLLLPQRDTAWNFNDLSPKIIDQLKAIDQKYQHEIPTIFQITYLRIFDEIHYGEKNWGTIFNLIRYLTYSVDMENARTCFFYLLCSINVEKLRSDNLPKLF